MLGSAFAWEESGVIPDVWRMNIKDIIDEDDEEKQDDGDKQESPEETEKVAVVLIDSYSGERCLMCSTPLAVLCSG